jgi:regulator of protease activity HflC (stomatin/prohibitin superfamily)
MDVTTFAFVLFGVVALAFLLLLMNMIRVVREYERLIVFHFRALHRAEGSGDHFSDSDRGRGGSR